MTTTVSFGYEVPGLKVVVQGDADQAYILDVRQPDDAAIDPAGLLAEIVFGADYSGTWSATTSALDDGGVRFTWSLTDEEVALLRGRYIARLRVSRGDVQTIWARGTMEVRR